MNLFVILLLPAVSAITSKNVPRKCYQGVFLENSKRTAADLTIVEAKVCLAQLVYDVVREVDVVLDDGTRGARRICKPSTIWAEARPARDEEIMNRWHKLPDNPKWTPGAVSPGHEIELEDDAEERRWAEANGSITRQPDRPAIDDDEDAILPPHCEWAPLLLKDNITCYCYTDYCNDGNNAEKFMKLLLSNCYTRQQPNETDQQYRAKCLGETKNAISCLQKPIERALQAKPRPPVDVMRNSTGDIGSVTWNPDDEYQRKYTTPKPRANTTTTEADEEQPNSTWKYIVIGICSSLFILAATGFGIFLFIKRRKAKRQQLEEEDEEEGEDGEEEDEEEGGMTGREATEMSEKPSIFNGGSDESKSNETSRSGILKVTKMRIPELGLDGGSSGSSGGSHLGGEASDSAGGEGSGGEGSGGQKQGQQKGQKHGQQRGQKKGQQKGKKSNTGKGKKTNSKDKKGQKKGKSKVKKGAKKGKSKQKKTKTIQTGKKGTRGGKGKKKK